MTAAPRSVVFVSVVLRAAALLGLAAPAAAQVGSALVAVPWAPERTLDSTSYVIGLGADTTDDAFGAGDDLTLVRAVSFGRYRLDADDPRSLSVGWLYDHTDLSTDDPRLPGRLTTTAVALGAPLGRFDGWDTGFTAGAGFAGDLPFADDEAWFGVGSLFARKQLGQTPTFITWLIDFDGSRAFLPDVPLPAVQYTVRESDTLSYSIGLPFSSLSWQPSDHWSVEVKFLIPIGGSAQVSYQATDQWSAYVSLENTTRAYHLAGDRDNQRLFFEQSRFEVGTRYALTPELTLSAAGGYAFAQEFSLGFDTRDLTTLREVDDAPYLRVGIGTTF